MDEWQLQFDWVLTFQAKPNALNLENTLRERYGFEGTPIWIKYRPKGGKKGDK